MVEVCSANKMYALQRLPSSVDLPNTVSYKRRHQNISVSIRVIKTNAFTRLIIQYSDITVFRRSTPPSPREKAPSNSESPISKPPPAPAPQPSSPARDNGSSGGDFGIRAAAWLFTADPASPVELQLRHGSGNSVPASVPTRGLEGDPTYRHRLDLETNANWLLAAAGCFVGLEARP